MLKNKNFKIFAIISVIIFIALLIKGINNRIEVKAYEVSKGLYQEIYTGVGNVRFDDVLIIKSEVNGRIESIFKDKNEYVNKDDLLITLDKKDISKNIDISKGNLNQLQGRYDDLLISYNNQRTLLIKEKEGIVLRLNHLEENISKNKILFEEGAISQNEYKSLLNEKDILENNLKKVEEQIRAISEPILNTRELKASIETGITQLRKQENELSKYNIKSIIDGIVLELYVKENEDVVLGQELIKIASENNKYVEIEVDEQYLFGGIKKGQKAYIIIPSNPEIKYAGIVDTIPKTINPDTKTGTIKIIIEEQQDIFIENMSVKVDLISKEIQDAIIIPNEFLFSVNDKDYVYVLMGNGAVEEREIKVYRKNQVNLMVLSGIEENTVIVSGNNLDKNSKVKVSEKRVD